MIDEPFIHDREDARPRYERMCQAFADAASRERGGVPTFPFALSGLPAALRIAGSTLRGRVERPLRHLRLAEQSSAPALRIDLWDETETGIVCEGCAVDPALETSGVWQCSPDGRFLVHQRPTAMEIYDRHESRIVGWSTGPIHVSHHERGRPLLRLLMQWHRDHGRLVVHGGLVADSGFGVLLVGKGGSGKSTTALLSTLDGLTFLSEDFLTIGRDPDGSYQGYGLYASAKLHPGHLVRFPRLGAVALRPEHGQDDKSLLFLEDLPGVQLARQVRIGAVVAPRVVDRAETLFHRITRGAALMDLAPSTLLLLNSQGLGLRRGEVLARNLEEFASLLDTCPSYRLELGHDFEGVAPALRRLIAEAKGQTTISSASGDRPD